MNLASPNQNGHIKPFRSPLLGKFYRYWKEMPRMNDLPLKRDLDIAKMPLALLPLAYIVAVDKNPPYFRFSLVGSGTINFTGRDQTARPISKENMGENAEDMIATQRMVMEGRRPLWAVLTITTADRFEVPPLEIEALAVPLSRSGDEVDYIMTALDLSSKRPLPIAFPMGILLEHRLAYIEPPRLIDDADISYPANKQSNSATTP